MDANSILHLKESEWLDEFAELGPHGRAIMALLRCARAEAAKAAGLLLQFFLRLIFKTTINVETSADTATASKASHPAFFRTLGKCVLAKYGILNGQYEGGRVLGILLCGMSLITFIGFSYAMLTRPDQETRLKFVTDGLDWVVYSVVDSIVALVVIEVAAALGIILSLGGMISFICGRQEGETHPQSRCDNELTPLLGGGDTAKGR